MTTRHPPASPTRVRFGSRPSIAAGFVRRQGQDELVEAVFARAEPRTVLMGMRGSGKTQLAAAVAARCEERGWPLVAWIHAASRKEILAGLYELALRIGIDAPKNIPLEVIVQRLLDQLRSAEAADRLFVFDNVENPDDLRDLIPEGTGVRTLTTTTRHLDWDGPGWLRLAVGTFEREQSIALLCEHTGDTHREAADRIAEALDGDSDAVRDTLSFLKSAAILQESSDGTKTIIPRLQGHVYRETYLNDQKKLDEACSNAATLLSGIDVDRLDNGEQRRDETHHLIEQIISVTSQDYSHSLFSEPRVSSKLAETLHDATSLGMSQLALGLTDSVTRACETLGPHHPDTLASRNNLAGTYRDAGRLDKAIALYEQILEDSIRILGLDHPRTLT